MAPPGWYDDPVYFEGHEGAPNFWIPDSERWFEAVRTNAWCRDQIWRELMKTYISTYAEGAKVVAKMYDRNNHIGNWAEGKSLVKRAIHNMVNITGRSNQTREYSWLPGYIDALLDSIN